MRASQGTSRELLHETPDGRVAAITDEYQQLLEMHQEYADLVLDVDDPEVHELWQEIQAGRRQLLGRIRALADGRTSADILDDLEERIDELNEHYWDLAALL